MECKAFAHFLQFGRVLLMNPRTPLKPEKICKRKKRTSTHFPTFLLDLFGMRVHAFSAIAVASTEKKTVRGRRFETSRLASVAFDTRYRAALWPGDRRLRLLHDYDGRWVGSTLKGVLFLLANVSGFGGPTHTRASAPVGR